MINDIERYDFWNRETKQFPKTDRELKEESFYRETKQFQKTDREKKEDYKPRHIKD